MWGTRICDAMLTICASVSLGATANESDVEEIASMAYLVGIATQYYCLGSEPDSADLCNNAVCDWTDGGRVRELYEPNQWCAR